MTVCVYAMVVMLIYNVYKHVVEVVHSSLCVIEFIYKIPLLQVTLYLVYNYYLQQVLITDEDIKQQEAKVVGARRKVEELLAAIEKSNREALIKGDRPFSAAPSEVSKSVYSEVSIGLVCELAHI